MEICNEFCCMRTSGPVSVRRLVVSDVDSVAADLINSEIGLLWFSRTTGLLSQLSDYHCRRAGMRIAKSESRSADQCSIRCDPSSALQ
jgi:hypothetical protein